VCVRLDVTSFAGHIGHNARLDITHNERAVLITALRRFVDFDPQPLSPQIQALKAILERLEPQKPEPIPRYCEHRVNPPRRRAKAIDLLRGRIVSRRRLSAEIGLGFRLPTVTGMPRLVAWGVGRRLRAGYRTCCSETADQLAVRHPRHTGIIGHHAKLLALCAPS